MFEVVKPGRRHGEAYLYAADAKKGRIAYIAGVNSSGYPIVKIPTSSAGAKIAHYPINKLEYQIDSADTTLATISEGERVIYYEEGEYITDDLASSSKAEFNAYKDNLYGMALIVNNSGQPTLAATTVGNNDWAWVSSNQPYQLGIAIGYVGNESTGYLHYRILPVPAIKHTKVTTSIATG